MQKPYKYLIVGEDNKERLKFINKFKQKKQNIQASQNQIHWDLHPLQATIADYPKKCFNKIKQNQNLLSAIIVLLNGDDIKNITSIYCRSLSPFFDQIVKIYCSKINLKQQNIYKQPKLILATMRQYSYQSNGYIYSNIQGSFTQQLKKYINSFKNKDIILKTLVLNKMGEWKLREDQNSANIKLIKLQLEDSNFQITQSQIQDNNSYLESSILQPSLSMENILNISQQIRLTYKQQPKCLGIEKSKPCKCQLI